jgi:2-methylisocitrate lyase-like PEP mutase family enzyme
MDSGRSYASEKSSLAHLFKLNGLAKLYVRTGEVMVFPTHFLPTLPELARLGVPCVSLAGGRMRSMFEHVRTIAHEFLPNGTYTMMNTETLSSSVFRSLFPTEGATLSHLSDSL